MNVTLNRTFFFETAFQPVFFYFVIIIEKCIEDDHLSLIYRNETLFENTSCLVNKSESSGILTKLLK